MYECNSRPIKLWINALKTPTAKEQYAPREHVFQHTVAYQHRPLNFKYCDSIVDSAFKISPGAGRFALTDHRRHRTSTRTAPARRPRHQNSLTENETLTSKSLRHALVVSRSVAAGLRAMGIRPYPDGAVIAARGVGVAARRESHAVDGPVVSLVAL